MSNRATPPRSFNTVKHSNREQRRKRKMRERLTLLSIVAVIAMILLTLLVFLICSIVDLIGGRTNGPENPNPGGSVNSPPTGITYIQRTEANTKLHTGVLVLVNDTYSFDPAKAADLQSIYDHRLKYNGISNTYQIPDKEWKLNADAIDALNQMMYRYYELEGDGSIKISSAYRSYADQENSTTSSTLPGHSDHHTGYCLALRTGSGGYLEDDHWIYENCHKYGYIMRYPDEKSSVTGVSGYEYCFRYVGVAHATYIKENNLCLEEYVDLLKSSYTDSHLQINGADGKTYEVYYIPAGTGDISTLRLPSNYAYTLSGDNVGGFIVTVDLSTPVTNA